MATPNAQSLEHFSNEFIGIKHWKEAINPMIQHSLLEGHWLLKVHFDGPTVK